MLHYYLHDLMTSLQIHLSQTNNKASGVDRAFLRKELRKSYELVSRIL